MSAVHTRDASDSHRVDEFPPDVAAHLSKLSAQQRGEMFSLAAIKVRPQVPHPMDQWTNAADWARDCIIWGPGEGVNEYQREILETVETHGKVMVRGPHTIGKTTFQSWFVWFHILKWEADASRKRIRNWVIVTTAGYWVQVEKFLWQAIKTWARFINWEKCGFPPPGKRLLETEYKGIYGRAFGVANQNLEGAHATRVGYVLDELKDIPDTTYEKMEGALAGAGEDTDEKAWVLGGSTPGDPIGKMYNVGTRKPGHTDWHSIHVTKDRAIAAGRMSATWAENRRLEWGETSAAYQRRVLGNFASEDVDGLIPLSWVEAANIRWLERVNGVDGQTVPEDLRQLGADVADQGEDKTAIAPRYGEDFVDTIHTYSMEPPLTIADRLFAVQSQLGGRAMVDILPSGSAIVEYLGRMGTEARVFNGSERASYFEGDREVYYTDRSGTFRFMNRRCHGYWHLRELLDPSLEPPPTLALPPDNSTDERTLTGDLTAPKFSRPGNVIRVEAKEDFKKRLGRSPDKGDAVVMALYPWERRERKGDKRTPIGAGVIMA